MTTVTFLINLDWNEGWGKEGEAVLLLYVEISKLVVVEQVQVAEVIWLQKHRVQIQLAYPAKTPHQFIVQVSNLLFLACFQCPDYTS